MDLIFVSVYVSLYRKTNICMYVYQSLFLLVSQRFFPLFIDIYICMLNKISRFGCCFFLFGQKIIFSDCRSMFARRVIQQIIGTNIRLASSSAQTDGEKKLIDILKNRFTKAKLINVKDTSSGCGASYEVVVVADEFTNMRTVNQHRLVSDALKKQLPNIHAIRIFTGIDEKEFID